MTEVVLVSCTKSKQDGTHAARDLYEPSRLFRKRREFARKRADHWGILSGKHGYLRPWEAVEYYEMHRKERSDAWGAIVLDDLLADLEFWDADQVTILAGKDYVDPLVPELEARGEAGKGHNDPVAYGNELDEEDHRELAETLRECDAKVAVSSYPNDLYDDLFDGWHRTVAEAKELRTKSGQGLEERTEALYTNYDPAGVSPPSDQQTLSVATDGGDENCAVYTANDHSGGGDHAE